MLALPIVIGNWPMPALVARKVRAAMWCGILSMTLLSSLGGEAAKAVAGEAEPASKAELASKAEALEVEDETRTEFADEPAAEDTASAEGVPVEDNPAQDIPAEDTPDKAGKDVEPTQSEQGKPNKPAIDNAEPGNGPTEESSVRTEEKVAYAVKRGQPSKQPPSTNEQPAAESSLHFVEDEGAQGTAQQPTLKSQSFKHKTATEPTGQNVTFSSFSDAFVNVLQSIQQDSQQLTPARGGANAGSLEAFRIDVGASKSSKKREKLDLASEVPATTAPDDKASRPADRVARRDQPGKRKRLNAELEEYFDRLTSKDALETAKVLEPLQVEPQETDSPATTADLSTPTKETPKEEFDSQKANAPNRIPPREPAARITREMSLLQPRVARALQFYFNRPLNTGDDSAWSIMHSMLGYGPRGLVAIRHERGQRTNVVQWLCRNELCANRRLLYLQDGYIRGREGPGYQGHPGQFLAMLAQIGIERDYPLQVEGRELDVDGLINSEMFSCDSSKELTFKLIALSYYLDSTAKWMSENGEIWDLPKMLSIEMAQPVNGAACGGTHRVMSIGYAVRNRWIRGEPVDGVYAQAQEYLRRYQRYALTLQNRDGSFSSDWFKGRDHSNDKDRQLQTTGHILEWLVYTLPRNELSDPRIVRAVDFLTTLMTRNRFRDWEVGPRGHAIRALSLYHQRVYERREQIPRMANVTIWSKVPY